MEHSPLEQFEIHRLIPFEIGGVDASFTNASLLMVLAVVLVTGFVTLGMRGRALVPGRWQSMVELTYEFIANMLHDTAGSEARRFFPFVFTVFAFVLCANLLGMMPYSYTVTSHIIVTFALAATIFLLVTLVGFFRNGAGFLRLFAPSGVPLPMLVILVPIELISYLIRPISLSVRLFANMMAGHTLLKVFGGFVVMMGIGGILPVGFLVLFTGLEVLVAVLQAYVFTVLTCIYLNDALHPHH
ncbi:MAG: F0F1 ATP synthase subunit A [Sphingomonadales bacterium]